MACAALGAPSQLGDRPCYRAICAGLPFGRQARLTYGRRQVLGYLLADSCPNAAPHPAEQSVDQPQSLVSTGIAASASGSTLRGARLMIQRSFNLEVQWGLAAAGATAGVIYGL